MHTDLVWRLMHADSISDPLILMLLLILGEVWLWLLHLLCLRRNVSLGIEIDLSEIVCRDRKLVVLCLASHRLSLVHEVLELVLLVLELEVLLLQCLLLGCVVWPLCVQQVLCSSCAPCSVALNVVVLELLRSSLVHH